MRYTKTISAGILAAVAAVGLLVAASCSSQVPRYPSCIRTVRDIKKVVAVERQTCATGVLREWKTPATSQTGVWGPSLPILAAKLRLNVTREVVDRARQSQALVILDRTEAILRDELAPAYSKAMKSHAAEDAKALTPIYDKIDKQMNDLLILLS